MASNSVQNHGVDEEAIKYDPTPDETPERKDSIEKPIQQNTKQTLKTKPKMKAKIPTKTNTKTNTKTKMMHLKTQTDKTEIMSNTYHSLDDSTSEEPEGKETVETESSLIFAVRFSFFALSVLFSSLTSM